MDSRPWAIAKAGVPLPRPKVDCPDTTNFLTSIPVAHAIESEQNLAMLALSITGFEQDPNLVSEILEIEPTLICRRGEVATNGRTKNFNGWWHDADEQPLLDGSQYDDALSRLLAQLRGKEDRFARLRATIMPKQLTIYGGLYVPLNGQCGLWLDPDQMQLLAACGVGWGLDLFVAD